MTKHPPIFYPPKDLLLNLGHIYIYSFPYLVHPSVTLKVLNGMLLPTMCNI